MFRCFLIVTLSIFHDVLKHMSMRVAEIERYKLKIIVYMAESELISFNSLHYTSSQWDKPLVLVWFKL